jgi:hypothetical protein
VRQHGHWVEEARQLRVVGIPAAGSPPPEFLSAVLVAQGHLDRVEELYQQALALKGGTEREADERDAEAQRAWDLAWEADQRTARGGHDYETARERTARIDLRVFEAQRAARQWRKAAKLAGEYEHHVRIAYFGLQGVRTVLLRALQHFSAPLPGSVEL